MKSSLSPSPYLNPLCVHYILHVLKWILFLFITMIISVGCYAYAEIDSMIYICIYILVHRTIPFVASYRGFKWFKFIWLFWNHCSVVSLDVQILIIVYIDLKIRNFSEIKDNGWWLSLCISILRYILNQYHFNSI